MGNDPGMPGAIGGPCRDSYANPNAAARGVDVRPVAGNGFSLVEILVVVLILGILAAVVIPMFGGFSDETRAANLMANLQTIRRQMNLYRVQHNDQWPGQLGNADLFRDQMTLFSDADGNTAAARSADFPFGPYLSEIPANALSGDNAVSIVSVKHSFVPPMTDRGWWYNIGTGEFRAYLTNEHALPDGRLLNQL